MAAHLPLLGRSDRSAGWGCLRLNASPQPPHRLGLCSPPLPGRSRERNRGRKLGAFPRPHEVGERWRAKRAGEGAEAPHALPPADRAAMGPNAPLPTCRSPKSCRSRCRARRVPQRRAGRAARRRQDDAGAACAARRGLAASGTDPAARTAPARRARRGPAHGLAARRRGRRHGRLRHAHGEPAVGEDAHPGRHRRHPGAHDPRRPRAAGHFGDPVRRVPRAFARRRLRAGAGARRARRAAPDLRLLVMSATLDGARVAKAARRRAGAEERGPQLSGRAALPGAARHGRRSRTRSQAIREALATESGSVLAFLPGQREIERTAERLAAASCRTIDIVPLYGNLDGKAQDAAIRPAPEGRRKVVLATSIAETSITIDGVRVVIDSGLSRLPRYEPATGITRLETVRVARLRRPARRPRRPHAARRRDPAVARRADRGAAGLHAARNPRSRPLRPGARLRRVRRRRPGEARLPRSAAGAGAQRGARAADDARRDRRRGPHHRGRPRDAQARAAGAAGAHGGRGRRNRGMRWKRRGSPCCITERGLGGDSVDLERRLSRFATEKSPRAVAARSLAERLARNVTLPLRGGAATGDERSPRDGVVSVRHFPDLLPALRGRPSPARGSGCSIASAPSSSTPGRIASPLRAASVAASCSPTAAAACSTPPIRSPARNSSSLPICRARRRTPASPRLRPSRKTTSAPRLPIASSAGPKPFDRRKTRRARARDRAARRDRARRAPAARADGRRSRPRGHRRAPRAWAVAAALGQGGRDAAPPPRLAAPRPRRALAGRVGRGAGSPRWTTGCCPSCPARRTSPASTRRRSDAGLMSLVPHDLQRKIDSLAPTHFDAPSGSRVPIRYEGERPVLAIRVQELFGLDRHPGDRRRHGAAHAGAAVAGASADPDDADLPGFWRGSWADVRSDMRGRYPKHVWPDDPLAAAATSRAKPRASSPAARSRHRGRSAGPLLADPGPPLRWCGPGPGRGSPAQASRSGRRCRAP